MSDLESLRSAAKAATAKEAEAQAALMAAPRLDNKLLDAANEASIAKRNAMMAFRAEKCGGVDKVPVLPATTGTTYYVYSDEYDLESNECPTVRSVTFNRGPNAGGRRKTRKSKRRGRKTRGRRV